MFGKVYGVLGESLDVLSDRQNLIASNIANANTPGYKAKGLDFEKVMGALVQSGSSLPMKSTSGKDITEGAGLSRLSGDSGNLKSFMEDKKDPSVPELDGNTVDLSTEMSDMASNAIRFEAVSGLLSKKFAELNLALTQTNP